ncbi:hypothetical protein NPIL_73031 [Nephila pilipes]|uniref:Uncharacterized protein n=1 Tax=Nephila pilipes TaxID=299642 RepID=A0A8X6Q1P1_NEPPI|nr:hypothetical protein NPIL_73031 [Nephila pilipes]
MDRIIPKHVWKKPDASVRHPNIGKEDERNPMCQSRVLKRKESNLPKGMIILETDKISFMKLKHELKQKFGEPSPKQSTFNHTLFYSKSFQLAIREVWAPRGHSMGPRPTILVSLESSPQLASWEGSHESIGPIGANLLFHDQGFGPPWPSYGASGLK